MPGPILLVFAHPDDESSSVGGTTAEYARRGVPVDLICATGGEKGTRLGVPPGVDTATARQAGLRAAAAITGIRDIYLLGYVDGELDSVCPEEVAGRVLDIMRKVRPQVVITFGPDGISGHPDHVAIGKAATRAFEGLVAERNGSRKLNYVTIPESAFATAGIGDAGGVATRPDDEITTTIDITEYLDAKIRALEAHSSQEDARWLADMFRRSGASGWAAHEYLYLASPRDSRKETDLFQ
jgi:LmbE family N-acetylglucosaminyl deacetylase